MAKTVYKENTYKSDKNAGQPAFFNTIAAWIQDQKFQLTFGVFLIISAFALFISFFSYFFTGKADQSIVEIALGANIKDSGAEIENWMGLTGAVLAHLFIYKWFGIAAFIFVPIAFLLGWKFAFKTELFPIIPNLKLAAFFICWVSLLLGTFFERDSGIGFWGGGVGFFFAEILKALFGGIGTVLFVLFILIVFVIYFFKVPTTLSTENSFFSNIINEFRNVQSKFGNTDSDFSDEAELKKTGFKSNPKSKDDFSKDIILEIDDNWSFDREDDFGGKTTIKNLHTTPPKNKSGNKSNTKLELEIDPTTPLDFESEDDGGNKIHTKGVQTKIKFEEEELEEGTLADTLKKTTQTNSDISDKESIHSELDKITNEDFDGEAVSAYVGTYDPTQELSKYVKPTIELLDDLPSGKRQVSNEELEANKDKIVETLSNYGIGISQIKATIGPTVTLYEIIPEAGVRISKIKNLEDDIALSLAALGIRIIAPIPGKGTIGIEVPNKKREIVSMRSVLEDPAFKNSEKALPIILGKSITNELIIADLTNMPHLLIAGATGQGKSVGINVFLTTLLYRKHPAELKFVLIDPKKVELTLFNKIEKHFLAKLPGEEDAIITDTSKVVYTLNSLCLEMEVRYNLMKEAACRNIKEYNFKFINRRLNPKKGHKFLPYLVLVIDELADLMMVAGKEVEQPLCRIAQLARAIGIHIIVATQRPSVNVITGIIKANFPARLSFKVVSKIDSRTILDAGGAEQLVGMGDLLFSAGSDVIRLQSAFLDTHEVERVCDFINVQQSYASAYELPELETVENFANGEDADDLERDVLFEEAARIIVMHQQGSTSLLQRRLKLGYNRAGRIIDQLEKYGIVGPFEGSKAREVLIPDEYALERLLSNLDK